MEDISPYLPLRISVDFIFHVCIEKILNLFWMFYIFGIRILKMRLFFGNFEFSPFLDIYKFRLIKKNHLKKF